MKILYIFIFLLFIYMLLICYIMKNKNLLYSDIDLNSNGFISFSELMYSLDTEKRYLCFINNKDYIVSKKIDDNTKYIKIIMEIYSLKDGLTIKKINIPLGAQGSGVKQALKA